jgi:hypothetical protein
MKKCCVCKKEKPISDFGFLKSSKDGYRYDCKDCKNEKNRKDRLKKKKPKKEKYSFSLKTITCVECGNEHTGYFSHVKKFCSTICSNKNKNKRTSSVESKKKWLVNNAKKRKESLISSRKKNWYKTTQVQRRKEYSEKLEIRVKNALRSRIKKTLKTNPKNTSTTKLVGCTIEELKAHIENQFQNGMSWDNWSQFGWHLDHIKPLSSAKNIQEMESLCHFTNLQPLWWRDNIIKSDKIIEYKTSDN